MSTSTTLAARPIWHVGAIAGAIAALVLYGYGSIAAALPIPMRAAGLGAHTATVIGPGDFAMGTALCTVVGTILAIVLARYSARPARHFLRVTVSLDLISLVFPLTATDTAISTRVVLACGHLLAATIVIPILTHHLGHRVA